MTDIEQLVASLLADPESLPLLVEPELARFGATTVVAPHPDDETLGCGGAIALLRRLGRSVSVLVLSDGAASHPNSRTHPAPRLGALRQAESLTALAVLGVPADMVTFFGLPDGSIPAPGEGQFNHAVARCREFLITQQPATMLVPWRRDPHQDHRSAWHLLSCATQGLGWDTRLIEYPIWTWERAERGDLPAVGEAYAWRLNISDVLPAKRAAIAAYRSQTTDLIGDDPAGFRLSPAMLAHFTRPWEPYLETPA